MNKKNLKSERSQRNYIIIALCAILVIMGVGYAAFSSMLNISGTANVTNNWCVGFDINKTNTYEVTKGLSVGTTPTGSMTYSGNVCETNYKTTATLSSYFYQPGDQIEYTLTIVNKSSITAAIKSIQVDSDPVTANTTKKKENIIYTINMPEDTTLSPNEETTMTVIAKFQNDTPIESGYTGEEQSLTVGINVEQDDGNGGFTPTPATTPLNGSIYRWSTTTANNGASIRNIGEYTTDASTLNKTYYLKHDVTDDIITASYVCFVYNNAEHCMKGGDGETSFAANTQMIRDYQTFNNLPDNAIPGCGFGSDISSCNGGGGFDQVYADSDGDVYVGGSDFARCEIVSDGNSYCI